MGTFYKFAFINLAAHFFLQFSVRLGAGIEGFYMYIIRARDRKLLCIGYTASTRSINADVM